MKKKKENNSYKSEIQGIIVFGFAIIYTLSLFDYKMGILGMLIRSITFTLMGFGGYFFPLIIVYMGAILFTASTKKFNKNKLFATISIFMSILTLLDSGNANIVSIIQRMKRAYVLSLGNRGGGIIGSFFGYFLYNFLGKIGGYITLLFIIIISVVVLLELNPRQLLNKYIKKPAAKSPALTKKNNIKISNYTEKKTIDVPSEETGVKMHNDINFPTESIQYQKPSSDLLNFSESDNVIDYKKEAINNANIIEETMKNFGISATVTQINKGPTITCYELSPSPGIKLSKIVSLSDNIALSLASSDIRIEAPIPGKSAVGIEVPNKVKDNVYLKEILLSEEFLNTDSNIPLALGKDVTGKPIVSSIDKMPHLLIAGATGSGKSVCINTIIMNIIYKSSPAEVQLMLIDPKVVELSIYNSIPHLLIPVVTDAKKATSALNWAVSEMERRYKLFAEGNVRDISSFNSKQKSQKLENLPLIVIIIDELADLMLVASQEIEEYISRLAQMARAAGIHLIVATQRPSVDVITGTIKANIPSRISFAVSSQIDSRTILDTAGAEKLLGKGDMLFYPSFYSKPQRIQGAFISSEEVERVVHFLATNNENKYNQEIIETLNSNVNINLQNQDELLTEAIELVIEEGQASISFIQRRLRVGYARAARLIDEMEAMEIIGGYEGKKPRKVLVTKEEVDLTSD